MSTDGAAPVLVVDDLSKSFGATRALDSVGLSLGAGEIRALLGGNGSGKSTLIKILSGYHRPDEGGRVTVAGEPLAFGDPASSDRLGVRFVHQDLGLIEQASVLDNIAIVAGFPLRAGTIRRRALRRQAEEALASVGLDIDPATLVRDLQAAQKTGVAVARALVGSDAVHLLVLDEPTATLPEAEVGQLLATVRSVAARGVAVLYVTHRLDEVFGLAAAATILRNGREVATVPMAQLTHEALLRYFVGDELDVDRRASSALAPATRTPVLRVTGLSSPTLHDIDLVVRPGEVVGVSGVTGSGREDLLRAVFGVLERTGQVDIDGTTVPAMRPSASVDAGAGYVPADRKGLGGMMDLTVRENFSITRIGDFWRRPVVRRRDEAGAATDWLTRLQAPDPSNIERPLATLSGGNQQKVVLAKWLRLSPRLLMVDEPTQGVDVGAKAEIHRSILEVAAGGAGVVVGSVDLDELLAICHRVVVLRHGRLIGDLSGPLLTMANLSAETLRSDPVVDRHRAVPA